MLLMVVVDFLALRAPLLAAGELDLAADCAIINIERALRAVGMFAAFARGAVLMAALAVHFRAVGVRVFDKVVVKDLAKFFAGADLTTAHALGFDWVLVAFDP